MQFPSRSERYYAIGLLVLGLSSPVLAKTQDAPPQKIPRPVVLPDPLEGVMAVVPSPLPAIPDDPPPCEGAMFDLPLVIEPPDIIIVEVLEALPGRPISGERLIRSDGTISLGFYGSVHVRGLTLDQAKVKIIHHLRQFLSDQTLGLKRFELEAIDNDDLAMPAARVPAANEVVPGRNPFDKTNVVPPGADSPPTGQKPDQEARNLDHARRSPRERRPEPRMTRDGHRPGPPPHRSRPAVRPTAFQDPKADAPINDPKPPAENKPAEVVEIEVQGVMVEVDPVKSDRVFVDIAAHNTHTYFVQGDVGSPGRLPFTGKETVLDAMNYAGGMVPTAEPADIHLYRPARGGKPTKDYLINYEAILKGDAKANLQIFPNDRLFVGRNAVVKKTIQIDRAMAPIQSILAASLQNASTMKGVVEANGSSRTLRQLFDYLWNLPGGTANNFDLKSYLEAVTNQPESKTTAVPH